MSTISPRLKEANRRDNSILRMRSRRLGRAKKMSIVARTSIGFEADLWHWICDMAHDTDCTVSEVVREMVRDAYERCLREE